MMKKERREWWRGWRYAVVAMMTLLWSLNMLGSIKPTVTAELFDVTINYVENGRDYLKFNPTANCVYGENALVNGGSGYVVGVKPRPENAFIPGSFPERNISNVMFRVWVNSYDSNNNLISLFHTNDQSLKYLEVPCLNANPFVLFIADEEIQNRVPEKKDEATGFIDHPFFLEFYFAVDEKSMWPKGVARKSSWFWNTVRRYHFNFREHFLNAEIEWSGDSEADLYMKKHPEHNYYFNDPEIVWQCSGWYLHFNYVHKIALREYLMQNHYIIFKLWKDEEHTEPLLFNYMKGTGYIGGWGEPQFMEDRFNYVAYPHNSLDSLSLFVSWEAVHYWWREKREPTPEEHTQIGYFTITLSNDGKTSATPNEYEVSGWMSIELPVDKQKGVSTEKKPTEKGQPGEKQPEPPVCPHDWVWKNWKDRMQSAPLANGCRQDYDMYSEWLECRKCHMTWGGRTIMMPREINYCKRHNLMEKSKKEIGTSYTLVGDCKQEIVSYEVLSECQNDCCNYTERKYEYKEGTKICPPEPPKPECPPHSWTCLPEEKVDEMTQIEVINGVEWLCYYNVMESKESCAKCGVENLLCRRLELDHRTKVIYPVPPKPCNHDWYYYSRSFREKGQWHAFSVPVHDYKEDSLNIEMKGSKLDMTRMKDGTYLSTEPVSRQQWLAFHEGKNYLGIDSKDGARLTDVTYQEVSQLVQHLNQLASDSLNLPVMYSLPSVEVLKRLAKEGKLKCAEGELQQITAYMADTIAVYDGKGRLVPEEKLVTAPEGARLRVEVGVVDQNGELKMVDLLSIDSHVGVLLQATPSSHFANRFGAEPSRIYRTYWRRCKKCGKEEPISENKFWNGAYHRTLVND